MSEGGLILGEAIGFRAWKVQGTLSFPMLASVTHGGTIWHPRRWTFAECARGRDLGDPYRCPGSLDDAAGPGVPGEGCTCGMYAAKDREHLTSLGYSEWHDVDHPVFIGEVGLAGKVIEGSQGWKGARGRIVRLFVPFVFKQYIAPLRRLYGVPVEVSNTAAASDVWENLHDPASEAIRVNQLAARLRELEGRSH